MVVCLTLGTTGAAWVSSVVVPTLVSRLASTPAPTPTDPEELNPTSVSPGLIGFLATFGLVLVSLLLFYSMSRRLRRLRYRADQDEQRERDEQPERGAAGPPADEPEAPEPPVDDDGTGEPVPRP